jgi:hypothetical protein
MKRSLFVLAVAAALVVVGCDTQALEPTAQDAARNASLSKARASDNVIDVHLVVGDGSASYEVAGRIKYTLTQQPILSQELFDVVLDPELNVRAEGESYPVNTRTFDTVNLTGRTSATFEQSYFLRGGPRSLDLHMQFEVTAAGVSLIAVMIE